VHRAVFTGLNEAEFDHYVVNSLAQVTRIVLYRRRQNELIEYFGVHRFETCVDARPIVVFRGEVGFCRVIGKGTLETIGDLDRPDTPRFSITAAIYRATRQTL
jgi:hypothetical protein